MNRPTLELATKKDITRKSATAAMCDLFDLTPEERERKISANSYHSIVGFRISFVMSYLMKGGLIEKVAPLTYRATEFGRKFLKDHPVSFTADDLRKIPGWVESGRKQAQSAGTEPTDIEDENVAPLEAVFDGLKKHNAELKSKLMDEILRQGSTFFENLVLDVLVAMGYGGSRADAAEHLGRSGDEGIDGYIKLDPLGLDLVVVQAKRYKDNVVNQDAIRNFCGSMDGWGANKGVFITASTFRKSAKEYLQKVSHKKVILIDGDKLLDLMLKHHVGTRVQETVEILDLDQNCFDDED
jgi:restriction system protein